MGDSRGGYDLEKLLTGIVLSRTYQRPATPASDPEARTFARYPVRPLSVDQVYHAIEAPKGELGFYVKSTGGKSPYRLHIRSPSFVSLQAIETMAKGALLSDLIAIVASLDPVMGEVDR